MHDNVIQRGTERILFVDDEPMLTALAKAMLGGLGYQVETRTSAVEALELFSQCPEVFDLVISDQTMPRMSGMEMALKMMKVRPEIPIILCSGYSEAVDSKLARELRIKDFLLKPISQKAFASAIRKALDEKQSSA